MTRELTSHCILARDDCVVQIQTALVFQWAFFSERVMEYTDRRLCFLLQGEANKDHLDQE